METLFFASIINVILFFILWFGFFRTYFVDALRHDLFRLRDNLFNYAINHNGMFEHPAFQDRWNEINAMIRFAHNTHLIFAESIFSLVFKKNIGEDLYYSNVEKNLELIDEESRAFLVENRVKQLNILFGFLIKSSLLLLIPIILLAMVGGIVVLYLWLKQKKNNIKKNIKTQYMNPIFNNYTYTALSS